MKTLIKTLPLYLPVFLAYVLVNHPTYSYLIAWLGSIFVLYWTLSGRVKQLPPDLPIKDQILRPIFFTQVIFVGYMALTSIFFFLNLKGVYIPQYFNTSFPSEQISVLAECQRYYLLAHIAFVTGVFLFSNYRKPKWRFRNPFPLSVLFLITAILSFALKLFFDQFNATAQIAFQLDSLNLFALLLSLSYSIKERKILLVLANFVVFLLYFASSLLTGMKNDSLTLLILTGVLLLPIFRRRVLIIFIPLLAIWLFLVPYYTNIFRQSYFVGASQTDSFKNSIANLSTSSPRQFIDYDWFFLVNRSSEVSMFIKFVTNVPNGIPFYGIDVITTSVKQIIPKAVWSEKPSSEELAMARTYENGVLSVSNTTTSAKPQIIADGYLVGGWIGVLATALGLGLVAGCLSTLFENWFGGYVLGTALIYNSFFASIYKVSSFEFMIPSIFWNFVIVIVIFLALRMIGLIVPAEKST